MQDYAKAIEWLAKSAIQGEASAQCKLGNCYYKGQGIVRDYKKAI